VSEAAFLALTGPVLRHFTPRFNLPGIRRHGILRPVKLCELAEEEPSVLRLRADPVTLRIDRERARISDQRALLAAEGRDFLDGHTLASWGAQLDRRVFLWPGNEPDGEAAGGSPPEGMVAIAVDAARLYRAFAAEIDLAPINTASALIRPALRGDWIYVPATEAERFPTARMARGLVKAPDRVVEVSLRGDLTLPRLSLVLAAPMPD
jgi:hypothetical protein